MFLWAYQWCAIDPLSELLSITFRFGRRALAATWRSRMLPGNLMTWAPRGSIGGSSHLVESNHHGRVLARDPGFYPQLLPIKHEAFHAMGFIFECSFNQSKKHTLSAPMSHPTCFAVAPRWPWRPSMVLASGSPSSCVCQESAMVLEKGTRGVSWSVGPTRESHTFGSFWFLVGTSLVLGSPEIARKKKRTVESSHAKGSERGASLAMPWHHDQQRTGHRNALG